MERWLAWTSSASVQAQAAEWNVTAPANPEACAALRRAVGAAAETLAYGECGNVAFLRSLALWRTPSSECGDGRGDCMDYRAWLRAWAAATSKGDA